MYANWPLLRLLFQRWEPGYQAGGVPPEASQRPASRAEEEPGKQGWHFVLDMSSMGHCYGPLLVRGASPSAKQKLRYCPLWDNFE